MRIEKLRGQQIYLDSNALIYAIETDVAYRLLIRDMPLKVRIAAFRRNHS